MTIAHKIIVALHLPRKKKDLVPAARIIIDRMSGNPRFPSPSPSIAELTAATNVLDAADIAAKSGTKGTIATRNEKRAELINVLGHVRDYVQGLAEANPQEAQAIAESAGMRLKRYTHPVKNEVDVKDGKVSGEVELIARRVARDACYQWQWSTDGKTWNDLRPTFQSRTRMGGLTPGQPCHFRFRAITRKVDGDWSQEVTFIPR